MEKQTFIKAIMALKRQRRHDLRVAEKMAGIYGNCGRVNLLYDNQYLSDALVYVLKKEMGDNMDPRQSWIEYFIDELEFGRITHLNAYNADGSLILLNDAGELYDFLKAENYARI